MAVFSLKHVIKYFMITFSLFSYTVVNGIVYTFQILIIISLVSGISIPSIFDGSFSSNIFFAGPIRLVKSWSPLPLPSAFCFSQTENDTPQLQIALTRFSRCTGFRSHGAFLMFSSLSLFKAC